MNSYSFYRWDLQKIEMDKVLSKMREKTEELKKYRNINLVR